MNSQWNKLRELCQVFIFQTKLSNLLKHLHDELKKKLQRTQKCAVSESWVVKWKHFNVSVNCELDMKITFKTQKLNINLMYIFDMLLLHELFVLLRMMSSLYCNLHNHKIGKCFHWRHWFLFSGELPSRRFYHTALFLLWQPARSQYEN